MKKRVLVIGASGQIGSELVPFLRNRYGKDNVIATGRRTKLPDVVLEGGPCIYLDALNEESLKKVIYENEIEHVYHMASVLSATGEKMPQVAWDININGLINVLEVSRRYNVERVIWPSSIAAFGPTTPRENTPNETILQPSTMYGITKVAGELLAEYYYKKYGLLTLSMRLPGIISSETLPGGGTTDYAVEIFYEAIKNKKYECFLGEDTMLPMMYQPDCLQCHVDLAEKDEKKFKRRVYNVTGMSFTAGELAAEIKKHIPEFTITYKPDFRQEIADSWPKSIDDSIAKKEWGWDPKYDLKEMVKDMLDVLTPRLKK
ncbi:MAG: NAD-dependent epimerase/dehydratase family protein [Candidatus Heimdallarchaeota archaeon]|nr:NAD-dependent epimerase/dehydratase family protein [Candidatus Heimdallarchaeota archaeon]MBY8994817.1 NAD-dependent epimerase/dehydratase family protein [Candidatus Heimdallarchaeota archaeon]